MIIGIDIGSTTTKAVAVRSREVIRKIKTKAFDAVTSATGILGKMTIENDIRMQDIDRIIITGAGASRINGDIFGIPTEKIDEIRAIGHGGMYLSGRDGIVITNIGTGTAIIEAGAAGITHIGGTGVGGGTIIGLSKEMLKTTSFPGILALAGEGDLKQVDLLIEDIVDSNISFLDKETTAANFGKMLDGARKEDIAIGIVNLVYQVIGVLSVFAARSKDRDTVVITGNGSNNALGKRILQDISRMYGTTFEFPADAEFATAIGAALSRDAR